MTIPSSKLDTWSNQGATESAKTTHERIVNTIENSDIDEEEDIKKYLQGSYKNHTNIHANSDVDVIIRLDSIWYKDLSNLSSTEKNKYEDDYSSGSYSWSEFKEDVSEILKDRFGKSAIEVGDKAIEIESDSLPIDADVLVAVQYRNYQEYTPDNKEYIEGLVFWTENNSKKIVNYPRRHYKKGAEKSDEVNSRFRETVRIFKNARSYLADKGELDKKDAPSYFLECLLYNVPNSKFTHDKQERFKEILDWLEDAELGEMECQNEVHDLFGYGSTKWNESDAEMFISKLRNLWENWYDM